MTEKEEKTEIKDMEEENQNNFKFDFNNYNKIYGNDYFQIESKLNSLNGTAQNFFETISKEFINKSSKLTNSNNLYLSKILKKIQNIFNLKNFQLDENNDKNIFELIQEYLKTHFNNLRNILYLYEQLLNNIKKNIYVLFNYFDIVSESIESNPITIFLNKELKNIINNWMFWNLSFENFNIQKMLNSEKLDAKLKDIVFNSCDNKTFKIEINTEKYKQEKLNDINLEKLNNQLSILKIKNATEILKDGTNKNYPTLKSLYLENSFVNINLKKLFPNLQTIDINSCYRINLELFGNLPDNIIELNLDKNGFINNEFNFIFTKYLINNDNIRNNLRNLSFKENNLNKIDFNQLVFNSKNTFRSLEKINLSKNKIYQFFIDPQFFPKLTVINLCNNYLSYSYFTEIKNIFIIQSGNPFLMNQRFCNNYLLYLKENLSYNCTNINDLSISYIPKKIYSTFFKTIKINNNILMNLSQLDLSFNHLNGETFFNFIGNNKLCFNIKQFNLEGNELNDTFFEKFIDNKYYDIFNNLKILNMSNNLIGNECDIHYKDDIPIKEKYKQNEKIIYKLRLIYKFIKLNKRLKLFSLTRNPIRNFFRIKKNYGEKIKNRIVYDEKGKIIINCFYSFLLKIKNELNYGEDKTRKKINIVFDCLLDININLSEFDFDNNIISFKKNLNVNKN